MTLIAGLFAARRVPSGEVVDAGCGSGASLRYLACLDRSRAFHCWDGDHDNVGRIRAMLHEAELANVSVHDGLLGKETSGQRHAVDDFFVTGRHAMGRRLGLAA